MQNKEKTQFILTAQAKKQPLDFARKEGIFIPLLSNRRVVTFQRPSVLTCAGAKGKWNTWERSLST